jgi:hypothetical protein
MKKFTLVMLITLLITPLASAESIEVQPTTIAAPVEVIAENNIVEVQEEIVYNYYHSETCGWCQKLNKFLNKHDAYEKLNINKIDVRTRGIEMVTAAEEHGIDPASVGTPFVTYGPNGTGSAIQTGFYGALELFATALDVEAELPTQEGNEKQRLYVILLGLLVIVGPLAYLGLKK